MDQKQITIDANLVSQELQSMLANAQFSLAVAGARIIQQERTIEGLKQALAKTVVPDVAERTPGDKKAG